MRAHLERRRTDDEADDFVVPECGRLKCLLCVFKSFINVQTVEIDHSIGATLAPQEGLAHTAVSSRCDWSPYLVVLIEKGLRRLLIQILHCSPTHKSISFVQRFSIVFPFLCARLARFCASCSSRFMRRALSRRSSAVNVPLTISSSSNNTTLGRLTKEDNGASLRIASRLRGLGTTRCGSPEEED